jgi:microcystin degradation protein MlrC
MGRFKIFTAGLATETNTFFPMPTSLDDFTTHPAIDGRCAWEAPEDLCGADALLPVLRYEGSVANCHFRIEDSR